MIFTYNRIDLAACDVAGVKPHDVIERGLRDDWRVPYGAIGLGEPVNWGHSSRESHVLIPLVPYLTSVEPDLYGGFLLQLMATAMNEFDHNQVARLHLSLGTPLHHIQDQGQERWQIHVGFALLLA